MEQLYFRASFPDVPTCRGDCGPKARTVQQRTHSFTLDTSRLDGVLEQPLFRAVAAEAKSQGIPAFAIGGLSLIHI